MESDSEPDARQLGMDGECRILTVSASLDGAVGFVQRLQALSGSPLAASPPDLISEPTPLTGKPVTIEYTLKNRYYSADVHFALYALEGVSPGIFHAGVDGEGERKLAPAVIFVWVDGEPYEKYVEELAQMMALGGYEPEVALAVRIPKLVPEKGGQTHEEGGEGEKNGDGEEDMDSRLISFGFEYVDATRSTRKAGVLRSESLDGEDIDVDTPRLPRVLDALSTIMWPSMRAAVKSNDAERKERDAMMEELLGELSDTEDELGGTVFSPYEFEERKEGWLGAELNLASSPVDGEAWGPLMFKETSIGFDDDFTGFELYRSLGSVSDFGGSDEGLPRQDEIRETAERIFRGDNEVLGSLQALREEIAEIEDSDEKRRLAARVALGLVYGSS